MVWIGMGSNGRNWLGMIGKEFDILEGICMSMEMEDTLLNRTVQVASIACGACH